MTNPKAFVDFLGHAFKKPSAQLTVLQTGDYRAEHQPFAGGNIIGNPIPAKHRSALKTQLFHQ